MTFEHDKLVLGHVALYLRWVDANSELRFTGISIRSVFLGFATNMQKASK